MTTALRDRLARRIARLGPITLADYMAEALADPELGYYATRDPLGRGGDFVTAPEVSQMFGELIGLWLVDTWQRLGAPAPVRLVELGPGRGSLIADALRAARLRPAFLEAAELHLVEISPALRQAQRERLADRPASWHRNLGEVPDGPLLLVANEYFDALPLRQFERGAEGWHERLVSLEVSPGGDPESGRLVLGRGRADPAIAALLPAHLRDLPPGSVCELAPAALAQTAEIARRVAGEGGAALIVDYGAAEPSGRPTLQAVRGHRPVDILDRPGSVDLTAHVDFAALARVARESGAAAHGPVPQGDFLRALGLEARAQSLAQAHPEQRESIAAAAHRLAHPDEMGSLFKAFAVTPPALDPPVGFM